MIRKFPAVFLLVFVVSGIILADQRLLPGWIFLIIAVAVVFFGMAALAGSKKTGAAIALAIGVMVLAGFRFTQLAYDSGPGHITQVVTEGTRYRIFGEVDDWPDLKVDRTFIKVRLDSLWGDRVQPVRGSIILKISDTTTALQRGDRVTFYGRIYFPHEGKSSSGFDYRRYLNLQGVFGVVYLPTLLNVQVDRANRYGLLRIVELFRRQLIGSFNRNLTPDQAGLAAGFLIGETRDIPPKIYRHFRDSGTLHLLAVSGSNVALIVLFAVLAMRPVRIDRQKRSIILILIVIFFAVLSHNEPSVVRAATMACLVLLGQLLQRKIDLNNIIAATAIIILLVDPAELFDVSFQLSFVTAWGLIVAVPEVHRRFELFHGRKWYRWLLLPVVVSIVAQLASMPVVAFYFHRIPLISPLANLIIVPLVSLAVLGVLGMLLANLVLPSLGLIAGACLQPLFGLILQLLEYLGGGALSSVTVVDPPVSIVLLAYFLFVVWVFAVRGRAYLRVALLSTLTMAVLVSLTSVIRADGDREGRQIDLLNIPGGIVTIVKLNEPGAVDLVVTSISSRRYSVFETIISPELERLGVTRTRNLFVLSGDFDAIEGLIRGVGGTDLNAVYAGHEVIGIVRQVLMQEKSTVPVRELSAGGDVPNSVFGYSARGEALFLKTGATDFEFLPEMNGVNLLTPRLSGTVLVVGGRSALQSEEWLELRNKGYHRIICSKAIQVASSPESTSPPSVEEDLPGFVFDLAYLGHLRLIE